jgi:hypothetical protein
MRSLKERRLVTFLMRSAADHFRVVTRQHIELHLTFVDPRHLSFGASRVATASN